MAFAYSTIALCGSHGVFHIAAETGLPLGEIPPAYRCIARWDVAEWCARYPDEDPTTQIIDVLDMGGWTHGGAYEPADEDFRAHYRGA